MELTEKKMDRIVIVPDCKGCEYKHGIPDLIKILGYLAMRLSMSGYQFKIDKSGYAVWWKKGEPKPKIKR